MRYLAIFLLSVTILVAIVVGTVAPGVFGSLLWQVGSALQRVAQPYTPPGYSDPARAQQYQPLQPVRQGQTLPVAGLPVPTRPLPPRLDLYSPKDGEVVKAEGVHLSGVTDPDAKIRVEVGYDGNRDMDFPDTILIAPKEDGTFFRMIGAPRRPVRSIKVTAVRGEETVSKVISLVDPAAGVPLDPHSLLVGYFGKDYTVPGYKREGISDDGRRYKQTSKALKELLNVGITRKFPRYREDYFDCSNASAMLWQIVTDAGFLAVIATGPSPWDPGSGREHAWVLVYCQDKPVPIEATVYTEGHPLFIDQFISAIVGSAPGFIRPSSIGAGIYYAPKKMYYDIYTPVREYGAFGLAHEWDWWSKLK